MPLDITAFRSFAGGDPDKIKESQRRRHKPEEIVDEIIAMDEKWRLLTGRCLGGYLGIGIGGDTVLYELVVKMKSR
jgi:Seryl-tRNA synthetase N-terminal domain